VTNPDEGQKVFHTDIPQLHYSCHIILEIKHPYETFKFCVIIDLKTAQYNTKPIIKLYAEMLQNTQKKTRH